MSRGFAPIRCTCDLAGERTRWVLVLYRIAWDVRMLYDWWPVNGEGTRARLTGGSSVGTAQPRQAVGTY